MNKELVLGYIDTVKALCIQTKQEHAHQIFSLLEEIVKNAKDFDDNMIFLVLSLVRDITIQTEENYNLLLAQNQPKSEIVNRIHYNLMELDMKFERKLELDEIGGGIGIEIQKHILENGGDIDDFIYGLKTGIEITNDLHKRK